MRRMVRCKLAVALASDMCPVQLSGGAFAVPKDEGRDRLMCDRRPQNSEESAVSRVLLPLLSAVAAFDLETVRSPGCAHR